MSETVYTDPALAASKEPFNRAYIVLTQQQNSSLQNMINKFPKYVATPGTGAWVNPGRIPSLAALFTQSADFMKAYKGLQMINEANRALFEESKTLKCRAEPYSYEAYLGARPYRFIGIGKAGSASLLPSDAVIIPKTIMGTSCSNTLPMSQQEKKYYESLFKREIEKHKGKK